MAKRLRILSLASAVLIVATAWAQDTFEVQARLGVVHYDAGNVDTYYNFIAAVPAHVFHYQGRCYESPLVVDTAGAWVDYFHDDLAAYFAAAGGLEQIIAVGDVSDKKLNDLLAKYNLPSTKVVRLQASAPPEMAQKLARDWEYADAAVLVPYEKAPTKYEYESAANGAALAAMLNAPLLFVEKHEVPGETFRALAHAGVKDIYLVEFDDYCGPEVNTKLENRGYNIAQDFTALEQFVPYMRARAGHSALMTYKEGRQSMAAALAGARYGGYCAKLGINVSDEANAAAAILAGLDMPAEKFELGTWRLPPQYDAGELQIAQEFKDWLASIGGVDPAALEWVTYFGPKSGSNSTYVTFERAIVGNPLEPTKDGCLPGRMPGDVPQNIFFANRAALYRAMIFGNPNRERSIMAFNSFVCHYYEQGYTFYDNNNQGRCVNEIFGVPAFNEVGVAERFAAGGYETIYDAGYDAGTYGGSNHHPINPAWHTLEGFFYYLNAGANFFYFSGHGNYTVICAMEKDAGCNETVPWGTEHWPAPEGKITSAPGTLYFDAWDNGLANIHSAVINFDACLVGAGEWNESGHRHGGAGATSSYVSVSWEGSGWFWCMMADYLTTGKAAGQALAFATGQTSNIYPQNYWGSDGTLMYYWAGDPFMALYQPSWQRPTPAPLYGDYGGHRPGGLIGIELVYFRAARVAGGAELAWATRGGAYAGFNIYREGEATAGPFAGAAREKVNARLIGGSSPFTYRDAGAVGPGSYRYWLEAVDTKGRGTLYGPALLEEGTAPAAFALGQNYPNPVVAATTITYEVPAGVVGGTLALTFYDLAGRRVAAFDLGPAAPGTHEFVWNGKNAASARVAPGVYIYRLTLDGGHVASRRLVVAK